MTTGATGCSDLALVAVGVAVAPSLMVAARHEPIGDPTAWSGAAIVTTAGVAGLRCGPGWEAVLSPGPCGSITAAVGPQGVVVALAVVGQTAVVSENGHSSGPLWSSTTREKGRAVAAILQVW